MRLALKVAKHVKGGAAERLLDLGQELVEGDWRHVAVQLREFGRPCWRQEVLSCRKHLAELDKGRSKLLEREPQTLLRFEMGQITAIAPLKNLSSAFEQTGSARAAHEIAKPMAYEDRAYLTQTGQVADRIKHGLLISLCSSSSDHAPFLGVYRKPKERLRNRGERSSSADPALPDHLHHSPGT